jgi:hypothetical protein
MGKIKNKCARFINLKKRAFHHTGIIRDKIATGKARIPIVPRKEINC